MNASTQIRVRYADTDKMGIDEQTREFRLKEDNWWYYYRSGLRTQLAGLHIPERL